MGSTAVGLDADLNVGAVLAEFLGDGLDAECGGVRVRAEEGHAVSSLRIRVRNMSLGECGEMETCLPFLTDTEGDDGGAIAGQEVLAAVLDSGGPRIPLLAAIRQLEH